MVLSRRHVLAGLAAAGSMIGRLRAEVTLPTGRLTTLSDGWLDLPGDFAFAGLPEDELTRILTQHNVARDVYRPECNLALYRDGTNIVLFDAGSGPDFMPNAGALTESLDAEGLAPEDITHVVFTHAHPDHIWGVLDDFDDPLFPDATHMMGRAEWDYWWNPETVSTIAPDRAALAVGAKRRLEAIEDNIVLFDDGTEIIPGIAAHASTGHTPGHMAFDLHGALICGDAIANAHVGFARPDWHSGADQDPETAAKTRARLLGRAADENLTLIGFHLPGGGIGRVARGSDGFIFDQKDI